MFKVKVEFSSAEEVRKFIELVKQGNCDEELKIRLNNTITS